MLVAPCCCRSSSEPHIVGVSIMLLPFFHTCGTRHASCLLLRGLVVALLQALVCRTAGRCQLLCWLEYHGTM
jgi:hypothetical protein